MKIKKPNNLPKKDLYALNLGYTMAAGIALFAFLGHWLDEKSGNGYKWTLTGMLLGFSIGIYEAWKVARRINEPQDDTKK